MNRVVNEARLYGTLATDPQTREIKNGQLAFFRLATTEASTDSTGARREYTEYHSIVAFGKVAESAARDLRKGSEVSITGRLRTRHWERDGVRHYRTEIVAWYIKATEENFGNDFPAGPPSSFPEEQPAA